LSLSYTEYGGVGADQSYSFIILTTASKGHHCFAEEFEIPGSLPWCAGVEPGAFSLLVLATCKRHHLWL